MRTLILTLLLTCSLFAADLLPKEKAFLDVIAYAEGTKNYYNVTFMYHRFTTFEDHPRVIHCNHKRTLCSSAAGRYQFLEKTWDFVRKQLGLKDFSPESQDLAALFLITLKDVNPNNISTYSSFKKALFKLNRVWASLPGSPYGQRTRKVKDLWEIWKESL